MRVSGGKKSATEKSEIAFPFSHFASYKFRVLTTRFQFSLSFEKSNCCSARFTSVWIGGNDDRRCCRNFLFIHFYRRFPLVASEMLHLKCSNQSENSNNLMTTSDELAHQFFLFLFHHYKMKLSSSQGGRRGSSSCSCVNELSEITERRAQNFSTLQLYHVAQSSLIRWIARSNRADSLGLWRNAKIIRKIRHYDSSHSLKVLVLLPFHISLDILLAR